MNNTRTTSAVPIAKVWRDPKWRSVAIQIVTALVVLWIGYTIVSNTITNLEKRGIATGFGFLNNPAGFGIIFSLIPYDETNTYGRTFVVGLLNTLLVSVLSAILASFLGLFVGIARLSNNWLMSRLAGLYIEVFRNVPVLLQIFFWYFAVIRALPGPKQSVNLADALFVNNRGIYLPLPIFEPLAWVVVALFVSGLFATIWLTRRARRIQDATGDQPRVWPFGIGFLLVIPLVAYFALGEPISLEMPILKGFNFQGGIWMIPELAALTIALSVFTSAFIAELVRSGVLSVSWGQIEAARALGLRGGLIMRLITLPQAMRVIVPPLASQYMVLMKNSVLATAIGYPDLVNVFMGTTLNQTGQAVEVVAISMGVYLGLSLLIAAFMNWFNKRVALVER